MQTIWKFPFDIKNRFEIEMPSKFLILHVECQDRGGTWEQPCLWAQVDPNSEKVKVVFHIYGTGSPLDDHNLSHVATFQQGQFVWHLYGGYAKP